MTYLRLASVAFVFLGAVSSSAVAQETNLPPGQSLLQLQTPLLQLRPPATNGIVRFTAAINANGTVFSCLGCNRADTRRLGVGQYQVAFGQNVQARNGWSRWVQADTLTFGTENAWCNTADRAGDANAVWVNCQSNGGPGSGGNSRPVDVSFFLFVAR